MVSWTHNIAVQIILFSVATNSFIQPCARRDMERLRYSKNDDNDDAIMLDELSWRAAKIRLEDAHTQSFLKRRPVKLRYPDAQRWVQANLGAETKDEFKDMVANGNLRTPYIPKNPSTYYRQTGDWISWDHFLKGSCEEDSRRIQPPTGKFD